MLYINGQPYEATLSTLEGITSPDVTIGAYDKRWTYDEITHGLLGDIARELFEIKLHLMSMTDEKFDAQDIESR